MTGSHVTQLEGIELEFEFAKAMGYEIVSHTSEAFVLRVHDPEQLFIFGSNEGYVEYVSFEDDLASLLLKRGQELGAEFKMLDGVAHCTVGGLETNGTTYTQALMRALILHVRNQ